MLTLQHALSASQPSDVTHAVREAEDLLRSSNGARSSDCSFLITDNPAITVAPKLLDVLPYYDYRLTVGTADTAYPMDVHADSIRRESADIPTMHRRFSGSIPDHSIMVDSLSFLYSSPNSGPRRHYASGGATYTVQTIALLPKGSSQLPPYSVLFIRPEAGLIEYVGESTREAFRQSLGIGEPDGFSSADIVIGYFTNPVAATAKYGTRGYKFALFDVGAQAQSVADLAPSRNLWVRTMGAFDEYAGPRAFGMNPKALFLQLTQLIWIESPCSTAAI